MRTGIDRRYQSLEGQEEPQLQGSASQRLTIGERQREFGWISSSEPGAIQIALPVLIQPPDEIAKDIQPGSDRLDRPWQHGRLGASAPLAEPMLSRRSQQDHGLIVGDQRIYVTINQWSITQGQGDGMTPPFGTMPSSGYFCAHKWESECTCSLIALRDYKNNHAKSNA